MKVILRKTVGCPNFRHRFFTSKSRSYGKSPPFRILFFGTDPFALETLKALSENHRKSEPSANHLVSKLHVVSTGIESDVSKFSIHHNISLHDWPLKDPIKEQYDLGILVSFGRLVPARVIDSFPLGILNVHPSLLPRWRGAAPIPHTILNGDKVTGISIISIQANHFDTGPIVKQQQLPVPNGCSSSHLSDILAPIGAALLMDTLQEMPGVLSKAQPQDISGVTYAHKLVSSMSAVNWENHTADQIRHQYQALSDSFFLKTVWNDQTVKLTEMVSDEEVAEKHTSFSHRPPLNSSSDADKNILKYSGLNSYTSCSLADSIKPGTVLFDRSLEAVCIRCRDSWVPFRSVILRKKMSALDFYNGYLSKGKHQNVCFQSLYNGLFGQE